VKGVTISVVLRSLLFRESSFVGLFGQLVDSRLDLIIGTQSHQFRCNVWSKAVRDRLQNTT